MSRPSPTRDALVELLRHYSDGMTMSELVAESGRDPGTVSQIVRYWRAKTGSAIFRISEWVPTRGHGGSHQPVYVLGPGEDARLEKPNRLVARKQINRRYRQKNKLLISARQRLARYGKPASPWDGLL